MRRIRPHIVRKSFIGIIAYLLGTAAAWMSVHGAFVIYLLTPWLFIVPVTRRVPLEQAPISTEVNTE